MIFGICNLLNSCMHQFIIQDIILPKIYFCFENIHFIKYTPWSLPMDHLDTLASFFIPCACDFVTSDAQFCAWHVHGQASSSLHQLRGKIVDPRALLSHLSPLSLSDNLGDVIYATQFYMLPNDLRSSIEIMFHLYLGL